MKSKKGSSMEEEISRWWRVEITLKGQLIGSIDVFAKDAEAAEDLASDSIKLDAKSYARKETNA